MCCLRGAGQCRGIPGQEGVAYPHVSSMQVKMLEGGSFTHSSVAEFLNKAVEPPPEISVSNAVRLLQDIGAFEVSA